MLVQDIARKDTFCLWIKVFVKLCQVGFDFVFFFCFCERQSTENVSSLLPQLDEKVGKLHFFLFSAQRTIENQLGMVFEL